MILTEELLEGLGLCIKPVGDADTHTGTTLWLRKEAMLAPATTRRTRTRCWGISQVTGQTGFRLCEESEEVELTQKGSGRAGERRGGGGARG